MIRDLLKSISKIYIAFGPTDFRNQINGLCKIVENQYKMDPYQKVAYIFCNQKKTSIKILTYDRNGFILTQKTLLNVNRMKFKWPRTPGDIKNITKEQLAWLLDGLEMYPKKYFKDIDMVKDIIAR